MQVLFALFDEIPTRDLQSLLWTTDRIDITRSAIRVKEDLTTCLVDAGLLNENEASDWMESGSKKKPVQSIIPEVPHVLVGRLMEMGFSEN